jgi:hypothetical protein
MSTAAGRPGSLARHTGCTVDGWIPIAEGP